MMKYDWLESAGFFTIDLGLDRVRELLNRLGNPEKKLRFISCGGKQWEGIGLHIR